MLFLCARLITRFIVCLWPTILIAQTLDISHAGIECRMRKLLFIVRISDSNKDPNLRPAQATTAKQMLDDRQQTELATDPQAFPGRTSVNSERRIHPVSTVLRPGLPPPFDIIKTHEQFKLCSDITVLFNRQGIERVAKMTWVIGIEVGCRRIGTRTATRTATGFSTTPMNMLGKMFF